MTTLTPLLVADAVTAGYPGREPVLRGASLVMEAGSRIAILGGNGSGKTTLMRCLSGNHRPTQGRVRYRGNELTFDHKALREHRRRVQLVLQDPDDQLFSADVTQDVSFGPMNLGLPVDEVRARVSEALTLLGASHLAERPTHQLSYGERKRVATAGAVAMRPEVLLLDEPTAGLDPVGVGDMLAALDRLAALGTTIAFATHSVNLAAGWADVAAVVVDHTVVQGNPFDLLSDAELVKAARLKRPWPLELADRLGFADHPRDLDGMEAILRHRLGTHQTKSEPTAGTARE